MTFTENDKLKAMAIVHIFETSRPLGDFAACVVLNDGAGVSYGINQFTHRSGSLAAVVENYLSGGGQIGRDVFANVLPVLKKTSAAAVGRLAVDERFKRTLRAAAVTREMQAAQIEIAFEKYLDPAIRICIRNGFALPLSLAVVYDSLTHGSWNLIATRVGRPLSLFHSAAVGSPSRGEMAWITEYVRKRHTWLTDLRRLRPTNYRTKFFLDQIATGNWDLHLPVTVHGFRLTAAMIPNQLSEPGAIATGSPRRTIDVAVTMPSESEPGAIANGSSQYTANVDSDKGALASAGDALEAAAAKLDRADSVITAVTSRTDAVKSLWTTVGGTIWQTAWAVFGFVIGLPKSVWIVVAVIAAALMLVYLYRQITLGKIREGARGA